MILGRILKKCYILPQHKIRDSMFILKENKFPASYIQNKEIRKQLGSIQSPSSSSETEDIATSSHPIRTSFGTGDKETKRQRLLPYSHLKSYKKNL